MLENLQMARPGQQGDDGDDDMMSALDELGNMIRKQQNLRDKTFRQGQDQRRERQRGSSQGPARPDGRPAPEPAGSARSAQEAAGGDAQARARTRPDRAAGPARQQGKGKARRRAARRGRRGHGRCRRPTGRGRCRQRGRRQGRALDAHAQRRAKPCAADAAAGHGPRAQRPAPAAARRAPTTIPIRSAGRCAAATMATTSP